MNNNGRDRVIKLLVIIGVFVVMFAPVIALYWASRA